jgi:hypothetical protein
MFGLQLCGLEFGLWHSRHSALAVFARSR